jgi:HAD superfamily hydrolase (TIGR01509 family)
LQNRVIKGIIFDMDGVLIDSEPVMFKASVKAFKEFGIDALPSDFLPYIGMDEVHFFGNVSVKYGYPYDEKIKDRAYDIYTEMIGHENAVMPNVYETVSKLKERGYKVSVASGAADIKVEANIRALGLPEDIFDYIITGSNVTKNKPDPDIFMKAAEGMGLNYEECLVVEDSISGIKASKGCGMVCVGITSSLDEEKLLAAGADLTANDLIFLLNLLK